LYEESAWSDCLILYIVRTVFGTMSTTHFFDVLNALKEQYCKTIEIKRPL
jgi:hypothetical protein